MTAQEHHPESAARRFVEDIAVRDWRGYSTVPRLAAMLKVAMGAIEEWCAREEDRLRVEAEARGLEGSDAWTVLVSPDYRMMAHTLAELERLAEGKRDG